MKIPSFPGSPVSLILAVAALLSSCESKQDPDIAVIEWLEREQERAELAQEVKLAAYKLAQHPASDPANLATVEGQAAVIERRISGLSGRETDLRREIRALEADLLAHADAVQQLRMKRRAEAMGTSFPTLVTRSGRTLVDVTVTSVTDSGVTIRHQDGLIRLDFHKLTPAQRDYFGIEEITAGAAIAVENQRDAALIAWGERSMAEAAERDRAAQAAVRDAAPADAIRRPPPSAAERPVSFPTPARPERYRRTPSTVYYYSVNSGCTTPRSRLWPVRAPLDATKPVPGQPAGIIRPATVRPAVVRPAAVRPAAVRPAAVRPAAVRPAAVRPAKP